jgi:hypothetical protein
LQPKLADPPAKLAAVALEGAIHAADGRSVRLIGPRLKMS